MRNPSRGSGDGRNGRLNGTWVITAGQLGGIRLTFGPQVVFTKAPPPGQSNLSPYSGLQFFGEVNIDAGGGSMTVDLRDINGVSVFTRTLQPRMG
jgi:alkaline phosphatase D